MNTQLQDFKARLGLFILGGIILFICAIFIIGKQRNMFNPVFKLTAHFYNISGLQVGNNIRFSGINVGTVNSISIINDSTVNVEMLIRKEVWQFITSDCKVTIGSEGLIGDRFMIITRGTPKAPLVIANQRLLSIEPIETDAILASVQVTASNAAIVSQQLSEILYKINNGKGTLGRLIQDTTIAENFNNILVNVKKSSKGLNDNMEAVKHNIFLRGYYSKQLKESDKNKKAEDEKKAEKKVERQEKKIDRILK